MRTPTWAEVEEFFKADEWTQVRISGHEHWEKVLANDTLRSHRSLAGGKTMSAGRFKSILNAQLKVSEAEFWDAIRTGKPVARPSAAVPLPPSALPLWLQSRLIREVGLSLDEIEKLDLSQAEQVLAEYRSRPKPEG